MSPGAHKSKTVTFHYVLHTFLYVPRQPSFLEGGFLGTFGARCFLLRSRALYGNVREFGNAGGSLGKRCLFFLTVSYPEIRLPGDRVKRRVKHLVFLPVPVYSVQAVVHLVVFSEMLRVTYQDKH